MADRGGFMKSLMSNPATAELGKAMAGFAVAQAGNVAGRIGKSDDDDGADKGDQVKGGALEGVGEATSEGTSKVWGGIKGALKGLFKKGGSAKRPTNIYEQLFIGVPVAQAYENWTEYSKFPEFMKGPESVKVNTEEGEDGEVKETHQWTAKIFLNRRSWKATVEEDVENSRIRWSTEAAKGTIDGAISFTPIGDNATLMVYTLEYRPKGFFEWWGNRWRTVGRRARLDVKHFGRYVMMQDQSEDQSEDRDDDEDDAEDEELTEAEETGELRSDLSEESDDATDNDVELDEDSDGPSDVAPEPEWEEPGPRRPSKPKPPRKRGESSE